MASRECYQCHKCIVCTEAVCYVIHCGYIAHVARPQYLYGLGQVLEDHNPHESAARLFAFAKDMMLASKDVSWIHFDLNYFQIPHPGIKICMCNCYTLTSDAHAPQQQPCHHPDWNPHRRLCEVGGNYLILLPPLNSSLHCTWFSNLFTRPILQ